MTLIVRSLEDEDLHVFSGESSSFKEITNRVCQIDRFSVKFEGGGEEM